jgi:molybdopterin/thiamine biosynthesis adenylyltransferase
MKLRIAEKHWKEVRRLTAPSFRKGPGFRPETGCILLVARNDHPKRRSLLVADVLAPCPGELSDQDEGGITFASQFLRRALLTVRNRGLMGFLTVHTHPMADGRVSFSSYDDANDPDLMANLAELEPNGLFGSMVLGQNSACGRVWTRGRVEYLEELVSVGEGLAFLDLSGMGNAPYPKPETIFDRGMAVTGAGAMHRLSTFRVGVIGTGGTGSLMVELLTRTGVGEIVIFEFDVSDRTNLNRVLHLRQRDADSKTIKGVRMAEAVKETGLPTKVTIIEGGDIRNGDVADQLKGCDLLVGCVDRDWPRLILSEVAYQYLIPYLDLGTEIGAEGGVIQSLDSRVSYVSPGRPCLRCTKVISADGVRLEGYDSAESARVVSMGYSKDLVLGAPAVMDLNMRAASTTMLWIRHLLQPFLALPMPHALKETVTNLSTKQLRYVSVLGCNICDEPLRLGSGSRFRLTTKVGIDTEKCA